MAASLISSPPLYLRTAVFLSNQPGPPQPIPAPVLRDRVVAMLKNSPDALRVFKKAHSGADLDEFFAELFGVVEDDETAGE